MLHRDVPCPVILVHIYHVSPDESDQKVGGAVFAPLTGPIGSVENPLDEDHGDEVTEQEQQEHQLGYELQQYGVVLGVVHFVPQTIMERSEYESEQCFNT